MKTAFSTLGCPFYTVDEIITLAVANGYKGVEIRAVCGTVNLWDLTDFTGKGLAETTRKFKDNGLSVACVGTSINFCTASEAHRAANLETSKAYIEITHELGCWYIRTFGGPIPTTQGYLDSINWSREGYEQLCALADQAGITPLLETHDDFSVAPRVLDILNGVSACNLGVIWDILHSYRFGEPLKVTYEMLKDRIKHIHIKDSAEFSAAGFDLTLIGEGNVPVLECIDILRQGGYDGFYSFEWEKLWHPEIQEPEVAIPHFAQFIRDSRFAI